MPSATRCAAVARKRAEIRLDLGRPGRPGRAPILVSLRWAPRASDCAILRACGSPLECGFGVGSCLRGFPHSAKADGKNCVQQSRLGDLAVQLGAAEVFQSCPLWPGDAKSPKFFGVAACERQWLPLLSCFVPSSGHVHIVGHNVFYIQ